MLFINHIAGGLVFTGVTASLCGDNLFDSPTKIFVCLIGAALPDIDSPKSPIGYVLQPISKFLNRKYGHRTITHTALMLVLCTAFFSLFNFHPLIFFLAYFSHLLFDMLTVQGVPLFYPFAKNPAVIPGDASKRFRTGDMKAESISFASFLLIGVTMQPLMENGFWTTYNSQFGTQKHLASEFAKSKDLLEVEYTYKVGTDLKTERGYCIDATQSKTVVLLPPFGGTEGGFRVLDEVQKITFQHTGKTFSIQTLNFIDISVDSLNDLVSNKHITQIEVLASQTARKTEGGLTEDFKSFKAEYPSKLLFYALKDSLVKSDSFYFLKSNSRALKENQINLLKSEFELKRKRYELAQSEIATLQRDTTRDYLQRERNMKRIEELKRVNVSDYDSELLQLQIKKLENEILIDENQESQRYAIEYAKYAQNQLAKSDSRTSAHFSGYIRLLTISQ